MSRKNHSKSKESNTNYRRTRATSLLFNNKHDFKREHECKREIFKITPYENSHKLIAFCKEKYRKLHVQLLKLVINILHH
jgi:hypothetical protein